MVELIVGSRGSGKTKRLIDSVNAKANESLGNVICIEKGDALGFNVRADLVRLIDIEEYDISSADAYYGFISGLLAGNYDITNIFCDATFKIICGEGKDCTVLETFVNRIQALGKNHNCVVTFSVSADEADLPASLKPMII